MKVAAGVQWDLLDARAAIRACRAALSLYPTSSRLQFQLGRALIRAQRRDEGLPYLFEAANNNYLVAFANIGGTYQFDLGNTAEALKWYQKGVALGDVSSQTHLGDMYLHGVGVERNLTRASELFGPSAARGYPLAQYKMGVIYQYGDKRVPKNPKLAAEWFTRAAKAGFARAQNDLGYLYQRGEGVRRNQAQAAGWYRLAAEQGWALAQVNLADAYENGRGVRKDFTEAFYWYRLGTEAREGPIRKSAQDGVTRLKNRISPEQVARVDQRIGKWSSVTENESAGLVKVSGLVPLAPFKEMPQTADSGYLPPTGGADVAYLPPDDGGSAAADPGYVPPDSGSAAAADATYQPPASADATYQPPAGGASEASAQTSGAIASMRPSYGQYRATTTVNVRGGPSTQAAKVGRLNQGDTVVSLGEVIGSDWLMVNLSSGTVGYVSARYLQPLVPAGGQQTAAVASQPAAAAQTELGKAATLAQSVNFGRYHALVIGNNKYQHLPSLDTAVNDAKAVAQILRDGYGFEVQTLLNATRAEIVIAMDRLRARLTASDNLLIYYAGHGILDQYAERGYWLPVDAAADTQVSWVSNATITDSLKALEPAHVMLIVDSCFSGTLTRGVVGELPSPQYYKRMVEKRVRVALTSGGLEPVIDGGGGGHSIFAKALIDTLKANEGIIEGTELFQRVRRPVMINAQQTPEYGDVRFAGHEGGDFIFVRRNL